jgi:tetratricopeptide (TPR) repeat protein
MAMGYLLPIAVALLLILPQQADVATRFNRAVELQKQGNLAEAAAEYRSVLALKPDYAEAQANLGVCLAQQGKYDEAVGAYQQALRLAPQLTPILLNLGIAYYRGGQFSQAAETLQKFIDTRPDSVQGRQLLGLALIELGRDAEAVTQLEATLTAAPQDIAVLYSLGLAYLRLGRSGFRATLERLAAFPAGYPALHFLEGQAFLRDQEYEKALEELKAAAQLNGELPRIHYTLGLVQLKLGHNKEAITAFGEELKRRPQDYSTLYYLAFAEEADGNLTSARNHVETSLKHDSQSAEANALLGKILVKESKDAEALPPLELAVKKDPNDPVKRYLLARVYQQLGRREDAQREFAEVQRLKKKQLEDDRARTPKP